MGRLKAKQSDHDKNLATKSLWDLEKNRQYHVFQTPPPPPPSFHENFRYNRGEGLETNRSPKPKILVRKDSLSRKIRHNETKVGHKKGGGEVSLQRSSRPWAKTC